MAITRREECAGHEHRQIELGPDIQVASVDIAAAFAGRQHIKRPRLIERHPHGAATRLQRDVNIIAQWRGLAVAEIEMADVGRGEILRQQTQTGDDSRPPPIKRLQAQNLDFEDVAGHRNFDGDRAGQRVELAKIEIHQHAGITTGSHLIIGHFRRLAMHHITGSDFDRRR